MKNSATDRIRAKLADAHPLSDSGDTPEIRNESAPMSGVTIDEDYLDSLFGSSKPVIAEPERAPARVVAMEAAAVADSEEQSDSSSDAASDPSYDDAASELVEYEATEETAAALELLAFHSAIKNDVDEVVEEAAAMEEVPKTPAPVVTARQEPVAPPEQPQNKPRVVRIAPASGRQPQKISGKARSFDRNQRQNPNDHQNNNSPAAPPPAVQAREQTVAPAVNRASPLAAPSAPVAPVAAPPVAVESAAAGSNKSRMLMIAAAAVMVVGGGAAMMYKGASKSETPVQAPQQTSQPAPVTAVNTLPTEPPPVATTQPTAPAPVTAPPVDPAKPAKDEKSTAAPIETAAQQPAKTPVPDGRAAPKQFVAPAKQQPARPTTTNTLVAEASPEISVNVQGGTIALPAANIAGRVPTPVAPKAETPAPAPSNSQTPAPPPAASKAAAPVQSAQMAPLTRLKTVSPEYPGNARSAKIEGVVTFSVTIGKDGKVASLRPISGNPMLIPAARNAISQWVYSPPTFNGQPTEATTNVQLTFTLR